VTLVDIARQINPLLRGWIGYYGRFSRGALGPILRYVNQTIFAWMQRKFKRFKVSRDNLDETGATIWMRRGGRADGSLTLADVLASL
jgi:RNA-directed DNA polymerase